MHCGMVRITGEDHCFLLQRARDKDPKECMLFDAFS